jgi:hypothetical protein
MTMADPDGEGMITRERLKRVMQWLTVQQCNLSAGTARAPQCGYEQFAPIVAARLSISSGIMLAMACVGQAGRGLAGRNTSDD